MQPLSTFPACNGAGAAALPARLLTYSTPAVRE